MNMYNQPDSLNWEPLNFRDLALSDLSESSQNTMAEQVEDNQIKLQAEPDLESIAASPDPRVIEKTWEQLKQEVEAQAYKEGFNLGRDEGFEKGFNEGKQAGYEQGYLVGQQQGREQIEQQLNEEKLKTAHAIANLATNFQQSINEIDELIVPKLFDLALIAAQKTVGSLAKIKQKQLIHTIQTLVEQCSILSEPMPLHLNPADLQWLEPMLNDDNQQYHCQLIANPSIEVGGCKIFTDTNEIDTNINDHWQMISDCLHGDDH
jgi:flagellar assembly protein FliH